MYTLLTCLFAVCPTHVILPTTGLHSCKIHGWQDRALTGNFGLEKPVPWQQLTKSKLLVSCKTQKALHNVFKKKHIKCHLQRLCVFISNRYGAYLLNWAFYGQHQFCAICWFCKIFTWHSDWCLTWGQCLWQLQTEFNYSSNVLYFLTWAFCGTAIIRVLLN
jgi:hypothetical protein